MTPAPDPSGPSLGSVVRLLRPRQWIKNLLVFASPAAAGVLDEPDHAGRAAIVFVAFCLAASGAYCLNDAADAEADRLHPLKRHRPVAAGLVTPALAVPLGRRPAGRSGSRVAGLTGSWAPVGVIAIYVALQPAYTYWLKHVAVIDLVVVAAGFVLRAVAGVVGTDVPDLRLVPHRGVVRLAVPGGGQAVHRAAARRGRRRAPPLARRLHPVVPAARARRWPWRSRLLAYCLWAFEKSAVADIWFPWFELSIVPFTAPAAAVRAGPRVLRAGRARGHRAGRSAAAGHRRWCGWRAWRPASTWRARLRCTG